MAASAPKTNFSFVGQQFHQPLAEAGAALNAASRNSQPALSSQRRGLALFIGWQAMAGLVTSWRNNLLDLFSITYGYHAEYFEIRPSNADGGLEAKMTEVQRRFASDKDMHIIIILHGYMAFEPKTGDLQYGCSVNSVTNRLLPPHFVNWRKISTAFERDAVAHITYIYDVHMAGTAAVPMGTQIDQGTRVNFPFTFDTVKAHNERAFTKKEIIAGNYWQLNQFGLRTGYLMKLIIETLKEWDGCPFTVAQLFAALYVKSMDRDYPSLPFHDIGENTRSQTVKVVEMPNDYTPMGDAEKKLSDLALDDEAADDDDEMASEASVEIITEKEEPGTLLPPGDAPLFKTGTRMLLSTGITVPGSWSVPEFKGEVAAFLGQLFQEWEQRYRLSGRAELDFIQQRGSGRVGKILVAQVSLPVEVWALLPSWSGFGFVDVVEKEDAE